MNEHRILTRRTFLLFLVPVIIGALVGVLFLFPVNELVFFYEHQPMPGSALKFASDQLWHALFGGAQLKTLFYALVGAFLGLVSAIFYSSLYSRTLRIKQLGEELEKDLLPLIAHGEGPYLEFKSTFRWDKKAGNANWSVEEAVLKTLAGFMNGDGGTLIIGVSDDGQITGLDDDYRVLKKKDRDGFGQALMTAVSQKLGTDACRLIEPVFHSISGKDVCRIIVRPAQRPVYLKEGNDTRFYLRTGVITRWLNVQEAVDFISERWGN
ncbi:MAG: helix-turn-helix domain-containing protein [Thermodesulfobacteriota bacterium]